VVYIVIQRVITGDPLAVANTLDAAMQQTLTVAHTSQFAVSCDHCLQIS
jgi:hypothetical protein